MMKHIIAYFSITTIPKVSNFDDESTGIQFYGQWHSSRANKMDNIEM